MMRTNVMDWERYQSEQSIYPGAYVPEIWAGASLAPTVSELALEWKHVSGLPSERRRIKVYKESC